MSISSTVLNAFCTGCFTNTIVAREFLLPVCTLIGNRSHRSKGKFPAQKIFHCEEKCDDYCSLYFCATMGREDKATWKANYFVKIIELFDEYPKCFLVGVDNVGSKQMQEIRQAMRGHAEILMGKNTMIRKAIRGHLHTNPDLEKLLPHIIGNVGFVFTKEDLSDIRTKLLENRKGAPSESGCNCAV
uniref:Large ribosomal subunit protein uL10 n=1 Tax=Ascaris suum TaxID=6253 RepID=F1LGA9_ASCSU